MGDRDQISYGRAARLRVALAEQAAELADSARGIVPTYADGLATRRQVAWLSSALPPRAKGRVDALEHSTMVMAGSALVRDRFGAVREDPAAYDAETRRLELGLTRRKVELYERMSAEGTGKRGTDPGQLADLLAGARARLAELE